MPPVLSVTKKNFAGQLRYLRRHFELISLARAVKLIESGEPPPHDTAAVTFDDGFRDNYESAFPILQQYGCPAAIFVATGPIAGGKALWPMQLFWWFKNSRAGRIEAAAGEIPRRGAAPLRARTGRERRAALTAAERPSAARAFERDRLLAEIAGKNWASPRPRPVRRTGDAHLGRLRDERCWRHDREPHGEPSVSAALSRSDALGEMVESRTRLEREPGVVSFSLIRSASSSTSTRRSSRS